MPKDNKQRVRRPTIPVQVRLELWARSAGRCEFRGCNKTIYQDDLTTQTSNLGRISHIIAFSPDGPRGNPVGSPRLAKDISNLMLTCTDHAKLIDDKGREEDYPVDLLQAYKKEHEERIKILTDIKESAKTHVLLMQVPIRRQSTTIDKSEAFQAILPKYPATEDPLEIDLSSLNMDEEDDNYWEFVADEISTQINSHFRESRNTKKVNHVSVFALAPIPLLVHLGFQLGSVKTIDLYQRHRSPQNWLWRSEKEQGKSFYEIVTPARKTRTKQIAVSLSVSGIVPSVSVKAAMGGKPFIHYSLIASEPSLNFLKSRERLASFVERYRSLLQTICSNHGHDCTIHLFSAVPAPIAIECGRSLLRDSYPPMIIYQFTRERTYQNALTINPVTFPP